jgi:hypothetical protein
MNILYTKDIPDSFFRDLVVGCRDQLAGTDPEALLEPLENESGLSFKAHNSQGNASGIFQAMPATLSRLGFVGGWQAFVKLDADGQLPWLLKYYKPMAGKLINGTAVYMGTFCPAWIAHAASPAWRICSADGFSHDSPLSQADSKLWYSQNKGLDKNHDGVISVSDLTASIFAADKGNRWDEIVARLKEAQDAYAVGA